MADRLTILLSGMVAGDPYQGGATWAVLQYVLGLRRLGHEVYFVEPINPASVRPAGALLGQSTNAAYFRAVAAQFGLDQTSTILLAGANETVGLDYRQLCDVARRADVLINISGLLRDEDLVGRIPLRVYLDLDPGFNQIWHSEGVDVGLSGHTHYLTIGCRIGLPDCLVPTCDLQWLTTLQPVVLEHWPVAGTIAHDALTTVANWRSYGPTEYRGVHFGQKAHSLRKLIELPVLIDERFLLALAIHPDETKDLAALSANRWQVRDPRELVGDPGRYRRFIQGSKGELGVAKSGYVAASCGWFSDRSVCYLASGRPVLAQQTGFAEFLPTGEGLLAFETCEELLAAIEAMNSDYARHARAARMIAEEFFDSDLVLSRLLRLIGAAG